MNQRTINYKAVKELTQDVGFGSIDGIWPQGDEDFWGAKRRELQKIQTKRNKLRARLVATDRSYARRQDTSIGYWKEEFAKQVDDGAIEETRRVDYGAMVREQNFNMFLAAAVDVQNIPPSEAQVAELIEGLREEQRSAGAKRVVLKIVAEDGHVTWVTLNDLVASQLRDLIVGNIEAREDDMRFSDHVVVSVQGTSPVAITAELIEGTRQIKDKDGLFFDYTNTTDIDLSEYQIYTAKQMETLEELEHCLFFTFRKLGVPESKINQLKLGYFVRDGEALNKRFVKISDLADISEIIGQQIILRRYGSSKRDAVSVQVRKETHGPASDKDPLEIAIFKNHYFVFEKETKYSLYCAKNYEAVRGLDGYENIVGVSGTRIRYNSTKARASSISLIRHLFDAGHFAVGVANNVDLLEGPIPAAQGSLLDNIENECREYQNANGTAASKLEAMKKFIDGANIYFADIETYTGKKDMTHSIFMIGRVLMGANTVSIDSVRDPKYNDRHDAIIEGKQHKNKYQQAFRYQPEKLMVLDFLKNITSSGTRNAICYFHNLKYDYTILEPYLPVKSKCEKGSALYEVIVTYKGQTIKFRDSCKHIASPLASFPKTFDLNKGITDPNKMFGKKEAIAYSYYKPDNYMERCTCAYYESRLPTDEQKAIFRQNMMSEPTYKSDVGMTQELTNAKMNELFDAGNLPRDPSVSMSKHFANIDAAEAAINLKYSMLVRSSKENYAAATFCPTSYYKNYLKFDCLVLERGFVAYRMGTLKLAGIDCLETLTVSSLGDRYMYDRGAYENVCELTGNLRDYVAAATMGGRVHVNEKYLLKVLLDVMIADFDSVSCYASAMKEACRAINYPGANPEICRDAEDKPYGGLPYGLPKRFRKSRLSTWNSKAYCVLTVQIKSVRKFQQMPFIAHKTENAVDYKNEAPKDPVIIDGTTLQDYIEFHDIEYEILDGIYWHTMIDGQYGNRKMGVLIQELFDLRLKYKDEGNVCMANITKTLLCSIYGKTILKKTTKVKKVMKDSRWSKNKAGEWVEIAKGQVINYVVNNYNTVVSYREMSQGLYEIEEYQPDYSYNRGHVGCLILSTSKRIMNRVFDVANTLGVTVYYTDCDSGHFDFKGIPSIGEEYTRKYKTELIGENLGQFHVDFELDGVAKKDVYSVDAIFLGKKSYYDHLVGRKRTVRNEDGSVKEKARIINGDHCRMKGVTKEGLAFEASKYADEEDPEGYFNLYRRLAEGHVHRILLNPKEANAKYNKNMMEFTRGAVCNRREFHRTADYRHPEVKAAEKAIEKAEAAKAAKIVRAEKRVADLLNPDAEPVVKKAKRSTVAYEEE